MLLLQQNFDVFSIKLAIKQQKLCEKNFQVYKNM